MNRRVAAVAVVGGLLLAGCAAGPSPAEQSASAKASEYASVRADVVKQTCDIVRNGTSTKKLAQAWVDGNAAPDTDTALYTIRGYISEGCPQYSGR